MKIAYLINQYPKVSHTFIRTEILALERQGISVSRIAMRGWQDHVADPIDATERDKTRYVLAGGILPIMVSIVNRILRHPARFVTAVFKAWKLSRGSERGLVYHLIYLAEACHVLDWLNQDQCTHVHAHFGSNATTVALLVQALGGPPYSFTVHGPDEFDKPLAWKIPDKIVSAKFVVAITDFCRSQLYYWSSPADWAKIHVVHCAIDQRFETTATSPTAMNDTIVCVGRLCPAKAQVLLVEAVAALKREGVTVQLVLAGDGDMRPQIEAAICASGLEKQVRITGWIGSDEVIDLLDGARALVLPSFAEGLPVVIMEAMARGRPVLSTYIAGIPELVRDGVEGFLVPAGNVEALTTAIRRLLELDPAELAAMGASAKHRVLERHISVNEGAKLARLFRGQDVAVM